MKKIYITEIGNPSPYGQQFGAIAEDGTLLGTHFCSNGGYAWSSDLTNDRRKETYQKYYPEFELINALTYFNESLPTEIKLNGKTFGDDFTSIEVEVSEN